MTDDLAALERIGAAFMDSYFVVDQELRLRAFNSAFPEMLGIPPAERPELRHTFCYDSVKLEICRDRCIALEAIRKNGPVRMSLIPGERPDGSNILLELAAVPLHNAAGEVEGVLVTHRDITETHQAAQKLATGLEQHRKERASLLKVIEERDREIEALSEVRGAVSR
jgi:PAS domain S-box-containing protein